MRNTFKKYLFGIVVATYVLSAIGIPVYLHYCGGELEEVNYVTASSSCCDGEEDDTTDNGCCTNENLFIKNSIDFTLKSYQYDVVKTICELFFIQLTFLNTNIESSEIENLFLSETPPPKVQNSLVISTSVIRI